MANTRQTVRQLREGRGWKQIDLAYHTGASLSSISNIESGRQSPRMALAQRIADALGVSMDAIDWTHVEDKPAPRTPRRPKADASDPKVKPAA